MATTSQAARFIQAIAITQGRATVLDVMMSALPASDNGTEISRRSPDCARAAPAMGLAPRQSHRMDRMVGLGVITSPHSHQSLSAPPSDSSRSRRASLTGAALARANPRGTG